MHKISPNIEGGDAVHDLEFHLFADDHTSFFQQQWDHFLRGAHTGSNTDLKFVSKSGKEVCAHQAVFLPLSSHLKSLVETSQTCGCLEDVLTLLLPDWDHQVVQGLVDLVYSGSITVPGDVKEGMLKLMSDLCLDIFGNKLLLESVDPSMNNQENSLHSFKDAIKETSLVQSYRPDSIPKNKEQENVVKKLSEVLYFLEHVQIKNEESLMNIKIPLEDLLSSLKYLPTEPSFDKLPTEIKTQILRYLCKSGSFVAATVCHEWRKILKKKLLKIGDLEIGKHCSNEYSCEDGKCFMPEELLKASIKLNYDVNLKICHTIPNVTPKLLADSLTTVSSFQLMGRCDCKEDGESKSLLTQNQIQLLVDTIELRNGTIRGQVVFDGLNLSHVDQDRLANCLLKIKTLMLNEVIFDFEKFIDKILQDSVQDSPQLKLSHLSLGRLNYPPSLSVVELADTISLVKTIFILPMFPLEVETVKRLIENEFAGRSRILNFFLLKYFNWDDLLSHEELKTMLDTFDRFVIFGRFSLEQKEAASSIPGVDVSQDHISKSF